MALIARILGALSARRADGRLTRRALALRVAPGVLALASLAPLLAPWVGRSIIAGRASSALGAEVTIGAADLGWLSGRMALERVAVRKRDDDVLTIARLETTVPGGLLRLLAAGLFSSEAPPPPEAILARGARLHVRRGPDGTFALGRLLAEIPGTDASAAVPAATARLSVRLEASEVLLEEGGSRLAIPLAGVCSLESPGPDVRVVRIDGSLGSDPRGSLAATLTAELAADTVTIDAALAQAALRDDAARSWLEVERAEVRLRATGPRAPRLEIERLSLERPRLRVERRADGRILLLGLAFDPADLAREAVPRLPDAVPMLVRRARIRGGALAWRDEALPTPFSPFEATLEGIDGSAVSLSLGASAAPGAPGGSPGSFELSALAPGLCESIHAQGILRAGVSGPGGGTPGAATRSTRNQGQLLASVRGLDLVRASGYTVVAGRIGARGGRASLDARLDLGPERFDGFARLTGEGVKLGGPGHISQVVPGSVPVSVERALELLRGDDGRIDLLVPLAGDRDTGRLDLPGMAGEAVGDALSSALGRALRGGSGK